MVQDTDEGLRDQFSQLFIEFRRDKKHDHGHELTVLLDEILERGSIAPLEYNRLNSVIALPEKYSDEGAEEEDEMTRVIKDTVDHVIQHGIEELSDLLMELRDEVGKEFLDALGGGGAIVNIDRRTETKVGSILLMLSSGSIQS